jgi:hypothetical protein
MTDPQQDIEHALRNYLAIILGFSELLVQDGSPEDPKYADYQEIQKAALAAIRLMNEKWGARS